jgi:outer membrane protein assembly factor BamB
LKTTTTFLFIYLCLGTPTNAVGEDWPQFRGPGGQGHSVSRDLPLKWDQKTNVAWKADIPGNGWSSPVLLDGRIYLTTAVQDKESNGPTSLRALCLDATSGDSIWNIEIDQLPEDITIHPKNSHASATPIVTSDRLYVHFASHGTAALDLQGHILWKKQIDYQPHHGTGSSPVLFENLLIFNCDGIDSPFVIALDVSTGDERWRTPRPNIAKMTFSFSTPLIIEVNDHPQLISTASGLVCGYNPRTGAELWMAQYPNRWSVVPRPVYQDGLILISTGYEGPAELLAIRPTGSGDVTESHIAWRADRFVPHNPSPIIHDGFIYLVSDRGIASCRELQTGKLIWKERLGGAYSASPILADNRVYFLSEDGLCTVIRAAPEFESLARNDLGERSLASVTPTTGALFIRTINGLYRIEE